LWNEWNVNSPEIYPRRYQEARGHGIVVSSFNFGKTLMATLEAIQTKIKRLQEQAEAIKARQSSAALERIVELIRKSGVTVADIEAYLGKKRGPSSRKQSASRAAPATAKYQDPKSGATWSGRGRAPAWIVQVKNRDRFLIDGEPMRSAAPAKSAAKRRGNYVKGPQPAKYRHPSTGETWSGRGRAPAWLAGAKDRTRFLIEADA
jgi:DNA-binding protein H-NS